MSGARHRRVGNACEREIVDCHRALGIRAERYPLSGASRFRGSGHDVDLYIFGTEEASAVAEVKKRRSGAGFTQLERWLGEYDALFLRRNHADPMIVLPWPRVGTPARPGGAMNAASKLPASFDAERHSLIARLAHIIEDDFTSRGIDVFDLCLSDFEKEAASNG
jgi:hypothetical protein